MMVMTNKRAQIDSETRQAAGRKILRRIGCGDFADPCKSDAEGFRPTSAGRNASGSADLTKGGSRE